MSFQLSIGVLSVTILLTAGVSLAQEPESDAQLSSSPAIEEIVVTGSRIKRRDFTTSSPLTTIDATDIAFTGQMTIEETLNRMPQVLPFNTRASNNPGNGTADVNLRGLGPHRTLVLLNGRRVAPSGTGNAVDLNNIPQFLIDRVEIITGGTSAVYGSDALTGVINFITKQDYSGIGIEASTSMTEKGDAETYDLNVAWGHDFENGRGNVTIFGNYFERKPLYAGDREFSRIAFWDDWEGNLVEGGAGATPEGHVYFPLADFGDGAAEATFDPDGTPREYIWPDDLYNYAPVNYLQIPLDRYALGVTANYDLTDRFEGYLEASFVRNDPVQNLAPSPAYLPLEINLDNPVLTPETRQLFTENYACDTNLACVFMGKRLLELGPRLLEREREYSRIVAGFRGELWEGWELDGWLSYTREDTKSYARNDASEGRLRQGMLVDPVTNECYDPTGGCVPLDIFGENRLSSAAVEFIRYADFVGELERTHKLASVFVTGSLIDTWAGSVDVAIGAEWRSDDTVNRVDPVLATGDALGWSSYAGTDGSDDVTELYAEAVVPLLNDKRWADYLGVEVGARYSDYKLSGGTWTYKAGAEWQASESLRLRAMRQRSVRAPNSDELFRDLETWTGTWVSYDPAEDPCSASADPVGNGNVEKCLMQGLPADQIGVFEAMLRYPVDWYTGGNPDLESETGRTWTLGAVITPESAPHWMLAVDYFSLEVNDTIGDIDSGVICFDENNTGNVYCENLIRDATGNVREIIDLTSNRGEMETTGVDTQVSYQAELPIFLGFGDNSADVSVNVYWTHMLSNKDQENPVTEVLDCAGYFGWPCTSLSDTYPEDRVNTSIHYSSGPLGLHLAWRWIERTDNAAPLRSYIYGVPDPNLAVPEVSDQDYLDLGAVYKFGEHLSARLGVNNLLDNGPPMMADAIWSNNTDTGMFDVFGRSYYLKVLMQY